jgi:hypothetical protein
VGGTTTVSQVTSDYVEDGRVHILQDKDIPYYATIFPTGNFRRAAVGGIGCGADDYLWKPFCTAGTFGKGKGTDSPRNSQRTRATPLRRFETGSTSTTR